MPMDRIVTVTEILADLDTIVSRNQARSLDRDTFFNLSRTMRRKLKALRVELTIDEMPADLDLTALGASVGQLLSSGALKRGSALLDALPDRSRTYGHFVVIDGDRAFETPHQHGA